MSVADVEAILAPRLADFSELQACIKFDFPGEGTLLIDATQTPAILTHEDGNSDCTLVVSAADMAQMLQGDLDPTTAVMTGRLKLRGSTGLAMKLAALLR